MEDQASLRLVEWGGGAKPFLKNLEGSQQFEVLQF